jgi:two-component sensor histidine kinase
LAQNDTLRVSLLREIGTFYHEQSRELAHPHAADSALIYAKKSLKLAESLQFKSGIAKTFLLESKILNQQKKIDDARQLAFKAIAAFTDVKNKSGIAATYLSLANGTLSGDLSEAFADGQKALQLYKETDNKKGQADALCSIAYLNMMKNKMELGRGQLLEALELYKAVGFKNVQRLNSLIAINYNQFGMRKEAAMYGLEAVRIIEERNDVSPEAAEAYNYVAIIYDTMHDDQKSFEYLQKADKIAVKYNDPALVVMLETNIIQMLMKFKRYSEALVYLKKLESIQQKSLKPDNLMLIQRCILVYTALKDFKNAKKYADRAMEISKKMSPDNPEQLMLYPGIIKYNMETGQYDIARKYALIYKKMADSSKNPGRMADIHRVLFRLDSLQLRFNDAIKNLEKAKDYEYSILNDKKEKTFQEMQVKYDSDKKDKDLLLKERNNKLLREQGELQEAKLYQANMLKNISFVGILLLIIFLTLVYRGFYSKQKNNKLLQQKNIQIDEKNTALQKLADEREWLLREIHHRVKNNLQIVMSLLNTQSHYLTDTAAMLAISSSQHRIHSMSLIHKKLYQSDNLVQIHMPTYVSELVEYLKVAFDTGQRLRFSLQIEEINLDISQAVPVGLILNEAVTNSIKHAFPDNIEGTIKIKMEKKDKQHCALSISDNGIGSALDSPIASETLGMKLIKGLSGDIEGNLEINNVKGYNITITFPFEENKLETFDNQQLIF